MSFNMKVLLAMMSHKTNTFSPVPTDIKRFGEGSQPLEGEAAFNMIRGTGTTMAGLLDVAEQAGATVKTSIAAGARPSGPVSEEAYQYITDTICADAKGCDAILLELHGAMVTQSIGDGEGALLKRLRAEYPGIPIAVGLDMHTNPYPAMVENATFIAGFHTYPHIDMYETGLRSGKVLFDALVGDVTPVMVSGSARMRLHVMRQGTDDFPNKQLQARCIELEQDGALLVSLFTEFPHADIYNAGLSVDPILQVIDL